jgi:hypothetical protein
VTATTTTKRATPPSNSEAKPVTEPVQNPLVVSEFDDLRSVVAQCILLGLIILAFAVTPRS